MLSSSHQRQCAMETLDYRAVDLFKDGRKVEHLRVSGLLVEQAVAKSLEVGLSALSTAHVAKEISLRPRFLQSDGAMGRSLTSTLARKA